MDIYSIYNQTNITKKQLSTLRMMNTSCSELKHTFTLISDSTFLRSQVDKVAPTELFKDFLDYFNSYDNDIKNLLLVVFLCSKLQNFCFLSSSYSNFNYNFLDKKYKNVFIYDNNKDFFIKIKNNNSNNIASNLFNNIIPVLDDSISLEKLFDTLLIELKLINIEIIKNS